MCYDGEDMLPSSETRVRSIVKSITYRTVSVVVDTCVAYFFTHELSLSLAIVIVVNGYSTFLYYGHERLWGRIHWGLKHKEAPTL